MRKTIILLIFIILTSLTTGCWDMVEIEQRLFPYSIGIDLNNGEGDKYIVTISYPNINAIGKNATQEDRIHIVSTVASSLFEGANQLSTRLPYPFYFKHLKVLVLGHELGRDEESVREILDALNRDFIINKKVSIVSAENMAKDVLLFIPNAKRQEVIEGTLVSMLQKKDLSSRYTPQSLTSYIKDTDLGGVAIMPRIGAHGEDIKVYGASLIKDHYHLGHIDELENRAIALMRGKSRKSVITAEYEGITISFAMTGTKMKRKLIKEDEEIKIKINLKIEGTLKEYILQRDPITDDESQLEGMEKALEKTIKKEIDNTLEKLQKEFKADAIGVGEYISKFHPKIWKEISKDWDEIFSELDIEVIVDTKIRRRGLVQ